jgi:hypothetical protein
LGLWYRTDFAAALARRDDDLFRHRLGADSLAGELRATLQDLRVELRNGVPAKERSQIKALIENVEASLDSLEYGKPAMERVLKGLASLIVFSPLPLLAPFAAGERTYSAVLSAFSTKTAAYTAGKILNPTTDDAAWLALIGERHYINTIQGLTYLLPTFWEPANFLREIPAFNVGVSLAFVAALFVKFYPQQIASMAG